jgi:hypothetical protein
MIEDNDWRVDDDVDCMYPKQSDELRFQLRFGSLQEGEIRIEVATQRVSIAPCALWRRGGHMTGDSSILFDL